MMRDDEEVERTAVFPGGSDGHRVEFRLGGIKVGTATFSRGANKDDDIDTMDQAQATADAWTEHGTKENWD